MLEFFEGLVGPEYALPAAVVAGLVVLLFVLWVLARLFRRRSNGGTFVSGGRNRKARLAVMDATAIDSHRRLVLVRRDDVEHLILIGGHADVVVERDIRLSGASRRNTPAAVIEDPIEPRLEPEPAPAPPPPQPVVRPAPRLTPAPAITPAAVTPAAATPAPRPTPPRPVARTQPVAPPPVAPVAQKRTLENQDFDDELLRELEVELDSAPATTQQGVAGLDDEMNRLFGEISRNKR